MNRRAVGPCASRRRTTGGRRRSTGRGLGVAYAHLGLTLDLVTSRVCTSPSPRAHPSGWTRTQGESRGLARPPFGTPPSGCGTGRRLLFYSEPEIKW